MQIRCFIVSILTSVTLRGELSSSKFITVTQTWLQTESWEQKGEWSESYLT